MASKMAATLLHKTYLTKKNLYLKLLNFDFIWIFKGIIIQTIKMKDWFDSEERIIENGVQDGRHFKAKFNLKLNFWLVTIF